MKKVTFLLLFLISFVSLTAQDITKDELKNGLEQGVVSFVQSVKSTLGSDVGANYDEFKTKLIGVSNLTSLPNEGNNLLKVTYDLIKEDANDREIIARGFNTFKVATAYVLNNEASNPTPKQDSR